MTKKLINIIILVPIGVVLIVLCVANRQSVSMALNPFNAEDKVLSVTAPFFVYIFIAFIVGLIFGSLATWFFPAQIPQDRQGEEARGRTVAGRGRPAESPACRSSAAAPRSTGLPSA